MIYDYNDVFDYRKYLTIIVPEKWNAKETLRVRVVCRY